MSAGFLFDVAGAVVDEAIEDAGNYVAEHGRGAAGGRNAVSGGSMGPNPDFEDDTEDDDAHDYYSDDDSDDDDDDDDDDYEFSLSDAYDSFASDDPPEDPPKAPSTGGGGGGGGGRRPRPSGGGGEKTTAGPAGGGHEGRDTPTSGQRDEGPKDKKPKVSGWDLFLGALLVGGGGLLAYDVVTTLWGGSGAVARAMPRLVA